MPDEGARALFPAAFEPRTRLSHNNHHFQPGHVHEPRAPRAARPLSTRARAILSLEMRGQDKKQIAHHLGLHPQSVANITATARYRAHRDRLLDALDSEFLAMKPLAMQALRQGLSSADEGTALKASDQWMRAAGFGQYNRATVPAGQATAEEVAQRLLQQVNITVNIDPRPEGALPPIDPRAEGPLTLAQPALEPQTERENNGTDQQSDTS